MRFATKSVLDAMSPANFAADEPGGARAHGRDPRREPRSSGMERIAAAISSKGQLTHTDSSALRGRREHRRAPRARWSSETPLYQLIQYTPDRPTTVLETPLLIFPPWINRFYILDLNPKKSFVRWAVEQGLTVFMVSWRSADESMAEVTWDDYVRAQIEAIDTVRDAARGASGAHDRLLRRRHDAGRHAGAARPARRSRQGRQRDLPHRPGRFQRRPATSRCSSTTSSLSWSQPAEQGLSRRPLHGRDLQPAARHRPDLELRDQQLPARRGLSAVRPAPLERRRHQPAGASGTRPICATLSRQQAGPARRDDASTARRSTCGWSKTPAYVQAGREDHIAPPESVWKHHSTFHRRRCASCSPASAISPAWSTRRRPTNMNIGPATRRATTLEEFLAGASEHQGSWWTDWLAWLEGHRRDEESRPRASARRAARATR